MLISTFVPECGTFQNELEAETKLQGAILAAKELGFTNIRVWSVVWQPTHCSAQLIANCPDNSEVSLWATVAGA